MMCQRWDSLLVSMICYDSFNFRYMMWQSHGYIGRSLGVTERLWGSMVILFIISIQILE
jgi:hypothetical protein